MDVKTPLPPSTQSHIPAHRPRELWPHVSESGLPIPGPISELEYFQHLIAGFPDMFKDQIYQFRNGTKARFWLQNAKLRVANVHLQRLKLLNLQRKMEIVPKDEAELKQLRETIELIHPALKEYDEAIAMFEVPYKRALTVRNFPFRLLDRFLEAPLPPTINAHKNTFTDTFQQVKAALDDLWYLDTFVRFGTGVAGGASLVVPTVIMTFRTSAESRLITVSVCVVLFAGFLATGIRASSSEILAATAGYAAVLVVFVGASN